MGWFLSGGTLKTSSGEIVGTVRSSETDAMMDLLQTGSSVKSSKAEIDPLNARRSSITFDMKESDFTELMRMSESRTPDDVKKRVVIVDSFNSQPSAALRALVGSLGVALKAAQTNVRIEPETAPNFIMAGGGSADVIPLTNSDRRYIAIKERDMQVTPALADYGVDLDGRHAWIRTSRRPRKTDDSKKKQRKQAKASRRKNRK